MITRTGSAEKAVLGLEVGTLFISVGVRRRPVPCRYVIYETTGGALILALKSDKFSQVIAKSVVQLVRLFDR